MLSTLLRGSRSNRAVDALVPSKDAGAIMAVESARVVLVDYGDEPQRIHETSDGFVVLGATHAVAMSDTGGLDVHTLDAADAATLRGSRPRGKNRAEVEVEIVPAYEQHPPGKLIPITDPVYTDRVKLPKYNVKVSPTSAHGGDTGKLLAARLPGWKKDDHTKAAAEHEKEAARLKKEWGDLADQAAMKTWGRKFQATDYRISGIGSDEFADEWKDKLRAAAHGQSAHLDAAYAHQRAAKLRRVPKESLDEAFATGSNLQALYLAAKKNKKADVDRLSAVLTSKGYDSEVAIVLRVAADGGDWDDVLDALLSEDVEEASSDPKGFYNEHVSESPMSVPTPEYPIYTGVNFDLSDLLLIPESGKSMVPYDLIDAVRRYVDTSPAVMRERRELGRRVRAALERDERFQTLLRENGLAMKSRYDESVVEGSDQYGNVTASVSVGELVSGGNAARGTERSQIRKFAADVSTALDPDVVLYDAVIGLLSSPDGRKLLTKYGYSLVESRLSPWINPQPNGPSPMKLKEYADLVLGENGVELVSSESDHVYTTVECDVSDEDAVAEAVERIESAALGQGFEEDGLDEETLEGEVFDEFEFELMDEIATDLADLMAEHGLASAETVGLFDAAVAECDYEAAVAHAEVIATSLGEAALDEFKRRRGRALSTFRRSLKIQTPAEKMRNRKARRAYKTNPAMRRQKKMYRKKFKRFLRNSTEPQGGTLADDVEVIEINHALPSHMRENYASDVHKQSFAGKAGSDDALLHAAMGFFGGTQGQTFSFAGLSASMDAAGYVGVKGATDSQMMSVLGRLVNEGTLRYVAGKGFTAVPEAFTAAKLAEKYAAFTKLKGEPVTEDATLLALAKTARRMGQKAVVTLASGQPLFFEDMAAATEFWTGTPAKMRGKRLSLGSYMKQLGASGEAEEEGEGDETEETVTEGGGKPTTKSQAQSMKAKGYKFAVWSDDTDVTFTKTRSEAINLSGEGRTWTDIDELIDVLETASLKEQESPGKVVIRPATDVDGTKGREVVVVWSDGREEDLKGSTGSTRNFVSDDEANPDAKIEALTVIARAIAAGEAPN